MAKFDCERDAELEFERALDEVLEADRKVIGTYRCVREMTPDDRRKLGGNIMRALRENHDLVAGGQGRSGEEVRECGGGIALVFIAAFFTTVGFVLRGLL